MMLSTQRVEEALELCQQHRSACANTAEERLVTRVHNMAGFARFGEGKYEEAAGVWMAGEVDPREVRL